MLPYLLSIATAALLIAVLYRYNGVRREPIEAMLLAVLVGGALMSAAGRTLDAVYHLWPEVMTPTLEAGSGRKALIVAGVEEAAKLVGVVLLARLSRHFDGPLDGLVYGTAVGIGAGLFESFKYLDHLTPTLPILGGEAIRLVAHGLFGGIGGHAFGLAYTPCGGVRATRLRTGVLGFLLALILHAGWDTIAFLHRLAPKEHDRVWLVALMAVTLAAWGTMASLGRRADLDFTPASA